MPLYPSKCCELGSMPDSSLFRCLLFGLTFESFKEFGVHQNVKESKHQGVANCCDFVEGLKATCVKHGG
jgi:hypothetical protein